MSDEGSSGEYDYSSSSAISNPPVSKPPGPAPPIQPGVQASAEADYGSEYSGSGSYYYSESSEVQSGTLGLAAEPPSAAGGSRSVAAGLEQPLTPPPVTPSSKDSSDESGYEYYTDSAGEEGNPVPAAPQMLPPLGRGTITLPSSQLLSSGMPKDTSVSSPPPAPAPPSSPSTVPVPPVRRAPPADRETLNAFYSHGGQWSDARRIWGSSSDKKREKLREKKWDAMFKAWKTYRKTAKKGILDLRVMKGIPDACRGRAWLYFVHSDSFEMDGKFATEDRHDPRKKRFSHYYKKAAQGVEEPRVIEGLQPLSGAGDEVVRLIRAYLNADRGTPYNPTMGYVASLLVGYLPSYRAYTAYLYFMTGSKHQAHNYFQDQQLREIARVWNDLLQQKNPQVTEMFLALQIDHLEYLALWLQAGFLNVPWPPDLRLRIFDKFLKFGTRAIFSFGLVIFFYLGAKLKNLPKADILKLLEDPGKELEGLKWKVVFEKYDKMFIHKEPFKRLLEHAKCTSKFP